MPGLLDFGQSDEEKHQNLGLLALLAGGNILAANQPGASFGQAVGAGISGASNSFAQMQQQQAASQMRQLQMAKLKQDMAARAKWQQMFGGGQPGAVPGVALPGTQVADASGATGAPAGSPAGSIPPNVAPYIGMLGPEAGGKLLAQYMLNPPKPLDKWEDIGGGLQHNAVTGETKPISNKMVDVSVNPNINMPPIQTEEQKTVGKFYGDEYTKLQSDAMKARSQNSKLDLLGDALDKTYTGAGADSVQGLKRIATGLGFNIEGVGEGDMANAISNQMALELRNPQGGAGMPGAMSDSDREFLRGMVPGLSQTPEGRKLLIEAYKRTNQRSVEVAKMARDYRKKHGMINEGFFDELQTYSDKNPLFKGMVAPKATANVPPPPAGFTVIPQ